jgi:Ribosomal protein S1
MNEELNFEELFEKSLKSLKVGTVVEGRVINVSNNEIFIDLGYKADGIITKKEYSYDEDVNLEEEVKIGDTISAYVLKMNDGEGNVALSSKKIQMMNNRKSFEDKIANNDTFTGKVSETSNSGLVVVLKGLRVFIPLSQVGNKVENPEDYKGKTVDFKIIDYNRKANKVIGSMKVILNAEKEQKEAEFWNNIEEGKEYIGTVSSMSEYGVFVNLGSVNGLLHISEISWKRLKHPSEVLNLNEEIKVKIISYSKEGKRISLTYLGKGENPWNGFEEKYKVGDIIEVEVIKMVPFGAFVQLEEGIEGLVHISQITDKRIAKPQDVLIEGQAIKAKIVEIDVEKKKIELSIKEVEDPLYSETIDDNIEENE